MIFAEARISSGTLPATLPHAVLQLADQVGPRAAAFDADGVLWHGDVSEDFTQWMIDQGHFDAKLWPSYEAVNEQDKTAGCLEILKFYRGHSMATLQQQVAEFWASGAPRKWIDAPTAAMRWLVDQGFSVFVVSGTPRVVLEPLTAHLPVPGANILGLDLAVDATGRATGEPMGVPTCGPGKAERLRLVCSDPILMAAGNSVLDIEMLQLSNQVRWVIDPDEQLREHAEQANWLIWSSPHA